MSEHALPLWLSILGGTLSSSLADALTFPMDMLKTRMQMGGTQGITRYTSIKHCISHTYHTNGLRGYYKGLNAALLRQFASSGIRISIYDRIKEFSHTDDQSRGAWERFIEAAISGGIASFFTTPLDVLKVRLITDPFKQQYKNSLHCLTQTYKKDGLAQGLYKGSSPNVYRALFVSAAELGTYDSSKALLILHLPLTEDNLITRVLASFIAGFAASVVTSPLDVVKTRYMSATQPDLTRPRTQELRYTSPMDCFKKLIQHEGFSSLYNGFWLSWLRLGPWCGIMLLSWDFYRDKAERVYVRQCYKRQLQG